MPSFPLDRGSILSSITAVDSKGREIEDVSQFITLVEYVEKERGVDKATITVNNHDLSNWHSRTSFRFGVP